MGPQAAAMLQQIIEAVKIGLAQCIHEVFVLSLGLMIIGLVAVLFPKEIPLRGGRLTKKDTGDDEVEVEVESSLAAMI